MGLIVLIAFWTVTVRLWIIEGPKLPLIAIALWLFVFFGLPLMGVVGLVPLIAEVFLTVVLIIIERYKSTLAGLGR